MTQEHNVGIYLLLRPEPMAAVTAPREPGLQATPMQQATPLSTPEQPVTLVPLPPKPKDYLFLSIISIFFFSPVAILALVFSLKAREANFFENRERALKNSRLAFCFSIFSMLIGCALVAFYIVLRALQQKI